METSGIIHLQHECSESTSFFQHSLIKWKIGVNVAYGNLGYQPLAGRILKIHPVFLEFIKKKKKKIGKSPLKIGFGNLGSIPPEGRISLRIYLSFLEFTKKICFYKICKFRHFFSYFTKTSEPHKKTGLVVLSSLFISDAFRL